MTPPTDAELIARCLAGHTAEFARIVERYERLVFSVAMAVTKDAAAAEDLAQETFIRAYRKLGTFDPRHSLKNWLARICLNLGKNWIRGLVRRRKAMTAVAEQEQALEAQPGPNTGIGHRSDVIDALKRLPDKLRIPLLLRHHEGFSYREIASSLRIGHSAAKMRVKRGRDELYRLLTSEGERSPL